VACDVKLYHTVCCVVVRGGAVQFVVCVVVVQGGAVQCSVVCVVLSKTDGSLTQDESVSESVGRSACLSCVTNSTI
jgi:hypothetical protein